MGTKERRSACAEQQFGIIPLDFGSGESMYTNLKYVSHVQGEIWAKEFRGVIAGSEKELEGAALIHDFEFDEAFGQDRELEYEEESKTSLTLPVPLAVPQFHVRVGLIVAPLAEPSWWHCQCRRRPEPGTGTAHQ